MVACRIISIVFVSNHKFSLVNIFTQFPTPFLTPFTKKKLPSPCACIVKYDVIHKAKFTTNRILRHSLGSSPIFCFLLLVNLRELMTPIPPEVIRKTWIY